MVRHFDRPAAFAFMLLLAAVSASLADDEQAQPDLDQPRSEIAKLPSYREGDFVYQQYLLDKGMGQKVRLWVPGGVKTLKGVIVHLGWCHENDHPHLQEFARMHDFAVFGTLFRWAGISEIMPDTLAKIGRQIGHPELAHAPWITMGFSRSGRIAAMFVETHPQRTISTYFGGSPGMTLEIQAKRKDDRARIQKNLQSYAKTPLIVINGSQDAFVGYNPKARRGYMAWLRGTYPKLRKPDLPITGAVEWGPGHSTFNNGALQFPFWRAVIEKRLPADADPSRGPVELRPFPVEDGWLVDPAGWNVTGDGKLLPEEQRNAKWGTPVPYAKYKGDKTRAVWLPDAYTAAVWRAFVEQPDGTVCRVQRLDGEGPARFRLALVEGVIGTNADITDVTFHDGDNILAGPGHEPRAVTDKLTGPLHIVFASYKVGGGRTRHTPPVQILNGQAWDQRESHRIAQKTTAPMELLHLTDKQRQTFHALQKRRDYEGPTEWKTLFADDFSGEKLSDAWYEYYSLKPKDNPESKIELVDGTLEVSGKLQAVAMLKYDWPADLAVECRAKAMGDRHCDLSIVISGNRGGTKFPWREGMMFQFGAHFNSASHFLVFEQPRGRCEARITPGKWHTLRLERQGLTCKMFIDGKLVSTCELTPHEMEKFFGRRVGLYTFGSTARFDDVKIQTRAPVDPSKVNPAMPSQADRLDLARGLVALMTADWKEQRYLAWRTVRDFSDDLGTAYRKLLETGQVSNEGTANTLKDILEATHPGARDAD